MPSIMSTPDPPQAKAPISEAISPDKSTDTPLVKDVPPSIESMLAVAWERTLSYLSPAGITTASYRVSKTLGAGEDKAESPENAAKLALEDMMKRAWREADSTYDGVSADDDYIDPSWSVDEMLVIPAFSGESFLRTYHLASVMLREGDRKMGSVRFHLPMVMWLLYGRPPLSPLSEFGGTLAHDMSVKVVLVFAPDFNFDLNKPVDTEEQRRKTKETLDKFNRPRLLHFAERLGKVGQYTEASMLLTMLVYDRPHMMDNTHIFQAEYYVGSRVMLKGLSKEELNGKTAVVEKEYRQRNGRIGVVFADEETGSQRMVGVKPVNLELHEEDTDTDFKVDVTIAHAQMLSSRIQAKDGYKLPLMALLAHKLRGIVAKLNESEDIEDDSEPTLLFPSKIHRLLHAQVTLARLLTHIAKKIAMKTIPCDFAGLTCEDFEQIKAIMTENDDEGEDSDDEDSDDDMETGLIVGVAQSYFCECVDMLGACERTFASMKEQNASDGCLKELARAHVHYTAGALARGLQFPFVAINRASDFEKTSKDHLMVAVAMLRTEFENLLHSYASFSSAEDDNPLTVDTICSSGQFPHSCARSLLFLAHSLVEVYHMTCMTIPGIIEGIYADTGEGEDYETISAFALVIAIRCLGRGHPMTDTVGKLYDTCCRDMIWGGLFCRGQSFEQLQRKVNKWLREYVPLYLGTDRQHPVLFFQLTGTGPSGDDD